MGVRMAQKLTTLLMAIFCISLIGCGGGQRAGGVSAREAQAANLSNLGAALLLEREYVQALPQLLEARRLSPANADVENYLGLAYYGMKEYDLALESYGEALRLDRSRTDVHNNMGLVHLAKGEYDAALSEFNICLGDLVYQKQYLPLANIGTVYMTMGRLDEALAPLTRAMEVAPDFGKAYQLAGRVYLKQNKIMDAVDYLNNAARLDPNDYETHLALGDAYALLNRPEDAALAYSQVPVLAPNTPVALEAQKRARRIMGFE